MGLNNTILQQTASASDLQLQQNSPKLIIVSGSVAQTIITPAATNLSQGWEYRIVNRSTQTVTVRNSGNTFNATITAGSFRTLCLVDPAAGTWILY